MKRILLSSLLSLLMIAVSAQNKGTDANIFGDVQCNGEHIPYINVTIDGTTIGTATDGTGHYRFINLPEGKLVIRVSGIGYKSETHEVEMKANKTLEINFRIKEDVLNIEGVVVIPKTYQNERYKLFLFPFFFL